MTMKRKELNPQYSRSKPNTAKLISIVILIFLALFTVVILTAPSDNTNNDNLPAETESEADNNNTNPVNETEYEPEVSFEEYMRITNLVEQAIMENVGVYVPSDTVQVDYTEYNNNTGVLYGSGSFDYTAEGNTVTFYYEIEVNDAGEYNFSYN